jgi:anaerobic magnesium-protoporphyrin IX monomethyl ester cyclase
MPLPLFHRQKTSTIDFVKVKEARPKNVLLVPPTSTNQISMTKWLHPNLGVERLAAYLRKRGHHAETFDVNLFKSIGTGQGRDRLTLEEKFQERAWDVIGFSVYEATMANDIANMIAAEKRAPGALIIAGGHAAQFAYQTVLDKSPARIVVLGEGEKPLLAIVEGRPLEEIPGIVVKSTNVALTGEEFAEVTTGIDYEEVPYEIYWDYYLNLYRESNAEITPLLSKQIHTVRIYTRNYCPMNCTFCSSTNWLTFSNGAAGVKMADFMGQPLIDLLKRILKAHPRTETVYFTDDEFCILRDKLIEFLHLAIAEKLPLTYICFTRIDDLDEEVIDLMAKAGFRGINVGVESFQQEILDEYNKHIPVKRIHEILTLLKQYNITPSCSFILASPKAKLEWVENVAKQILEEIHSGKITAGVNISVEPQRGASFYEEYTDFETQRVQVPGTRMWLKRYHFVKAEDPEVREFQYRFLREWATYIEDELSKRRGHVVSQLQSELKMGLVLKIIEQIKAERGQMDRFQASQMSSDERVRLWGVLERFSYGASL